MLGRSSFYRVIKGPRWSGGGEGEGRGRQGALMFLQRISSSSQPTLHSVSCVSKIHFPEENNPSLTALLFVLGGLGVTCSPRDPRFAGLNPVEVDDFFSGRKIPEHKSSGRDLKLGVPSLRFQAR